MAMSDRPTVLVVERIEEVASLYGKMLPDYNVITAFNMKQAVELLQKDKSIGLVLTTVKLQGKEDGYELCDYITKNHTNVRTVFSASTALPELVRNAGGVDLLIKPFGRTELEEMVKKHYPAKAQ